MRNIGLHLRIFKDLPELAFRAQMLGLQSFQCFLIHQATEKHIAITEHERAQFLQLRKQFGQLYVHGTYWINPCGKFSVQAAKLLHKELAMAKQLGFSHYILHAGSATGWHDRTKGIDALVKILDSITKREHDIRIVLENTAHGGKSVGSDLNDFKTIREKLTCPEKLSFCFDTAHAHSFGYDLVTKKGFEQFMKLLEQTVTFEALSLIHLNDTKEKAGSKHDKHELVGNGLLGVDSLKRIVSDKRLADTPIIIELPPTTSHQEKKVLRMVQAWSHKKKEKNENSNQRIRTNRKELSSGDPT